MVNFYLSQSTFISVMLLTDILHRIYLCKTSKSVLSW